MKKAKEMLKQGKEWMAAHRKESVGIIAAVVVLVFGTGVGIAYASGAFGRISEQKTAETEERKLNAPIVTLYEEKLFAGVNTEISLQDKVIESIFAEAGIDEVILEVADQSQEDKMIITDMNEGEEKNGVPAQTILFSAEGTYEINVTVIDQAGGKTVMPVTIEVGGELLSYVQGIREWTIEQGAENLNYLDGVTWDEEYIVSVTADGSNIDLATPGNYVLVYRITATEKLNGTTLEKTVSVEVVDAATAKEQADNGKQVMTSSGIKKDSNGNTPTGNTSSQTSSNAVSTPPEKETSTSGNGGSGNNSSNTNAGGNAQTHKHQYSIPITEDIYHPAETHTEKQWIVDKAAWTETVNHEEQGHYESVKVKDAWTEEVPIYEEQVRHICKTCGADVTGNEVSHGKKHLLAGEGSGGWYDDPRQVQVGTQTIQHDAVYEDQWVVDQAAWTETINYPEQGHWENVTIVDKAAWTEQKVTGYKCACGAEKKE